MLAGGQLFPMRGKRHILYLRLANLHWLGQIGDSFRWRQFFRPPLAFAGLGGARWEIEDLRAERFQIVIDGVLVRLTGDYFLLHLCRSLAWFVVLIGAHEKVAAAVGCEALGHCHIFLSSLYIAIDRLRAREFCPMFANEFSSALTRMYFSPTPPFSRIGLL